MLQTKAVLRRKETEIEAVDCVVEKVIRLSGAEFDNFSRNLMREWDFLRDNGFDSTYDGEGRRRCLLVVGEGRRDGILVEADGAEYARHSAFMPNAGDFLTVGQYPALAELNRKLTDIVDHIAGQVGENAYADDIGRLRSVVGLQDLETISGFDLVHNNAMRDTVLGMLDQKPEIKDWELDKNGLILYSEPEQAEDLSDPTVTRTDMYAYGYGWEGMIPLGRDRALELFDKGHEVFLLHGDDTEGAADSRAYIEIFDGMFGIEDPAWENKEQTAPIEVFILNREKYDKGEASGKWLALPADAGALYDLFLHIGVDSPGEGAFTVTAIRAPEHIYDYVSRHDSLDELNLLASYMKYAEDFEIDKFKAILTSGVVHIGSNTAALINVLCADNLDGFELIDAADAESLARHYHAENDEKPDGVSFEQYGKDCIKDEGGVFTESGYLKFKYKEPLPEYTGVVPDEYRITGEALQAFRFSRSERGLPEGKPSVLKQIRDAQKAPKPPRKDKKPGRKKEDQEL